MKVETCPKCGEAIVEGRFNCIKCGSAYPDLTERDLTWDPSNDDEKKQIALPPRKEPGGRRDGVKPTESWKLERRRASDIDVVGQGRRYSGRRTDHPGGTAPGLVDS
ncbi:MAG: hypothetical protein QOH48_1731 [Actinomycetota bacterium]|jgi:hypothetical protein|nr:hypothetical protein [Actinomycetota bacterium]